MRNGLVDVPVPAADLALIWIWLEAESWSTRISAVKTAFFAPLFFSIGTPVNVKAQPNEPSQFLSMAITLFPLGSVVITLVLPL